MCCIYYFVTFLTHDLFVVLFWNTMQGLLCQVKPLTLYDCLIYCKSLIIRDIFILQFFIFNLLVGIRIHTMRILTIGHVFATLVHKVLNSCAHYL